MNGIKGNFTGSIYAINSPQTGGDTVLTSDESAVLHLLEVIKGFFSPSSVLHPVMSPIG